jgi:2-oxoglutarate ferredoxin oxidoreductase subunit delta
MSGLATVTIEIDPKLCKGCQLCIYNCNHGVLEMSQERGKLGYLLPKGVYPEKCKKCNLCELACPDLAIEVISHFEQ